MKQTSAYLNQRACVLGAGVSGIAAARLLARHGGCVTLLDVAPDPQLEQARSALAGCRVTVRGGVEALPDEPYTLCVVSPSIIPEHPWLRACAERGIPVVGEMELGYAFWRGRILAVTGSKGKTSVVKLCADALTAAGQRATPAGNYGIPLSTCVLDQPGLPWAVVEVSSFQLEHVVAFRPDVAVLLNIQADHLDRHHAMAVYTQLKYRLFARQAAGDVALIPAGLAVPAGVLPPEVAVQTFGVDRADWHYTPGKIGSGVAGAPGEIGFAGTWFDNPVLGEAAAAITGALYACGLSTSQIESGLAAFKPLPHRMQCVGVHHGVTYIDDSKATSLTALGAALRMRSEPIRLIAGGRLKETDLEPVKELLTKRVKKVYLIGESTKPLQDAWSSVVECVACGDLTAAVATAAREAVCGDAVLLSPGCASFDQFDGYKQRGEYFTRLVQSLGVASGKMPG
jgi:UDP-N-acetylmuramoylalanine--D-glutamate ligase